MNVKVGLIGVFDMLKFKNLRKNRAEMIASAEAKPLPGTYRVNELAKRLHPTAQHLKIAEIIDETHDAKSFVLVPDKEKGTTALAPFKAGSYINVRTMLAGSVARRTYSLSSSPKEALEGKYRITVKLKEGGFLSAWLHNEAKVGDTLTATDPGGHITYSRIRDCRRVVALAGGSGITPFYSMADAIVNGQEDFTLTILSGSRTADGILLKDEIEALAAKSAGRVKVVHVLSDEEREGYEHGFVTAELIKKYAGEGDYSVLMCGPKAMYTFCEGECKKLGLPKRRYRAEMSGDYMGVVDNADYPKEQIGREYSLTVLIHGEATRLKCQAGESLLWAMERAGINAPSHCRSGECGWCHSRLVSGEVYVPAEVDGRRVADKKFGWIHPCVSYPLSDITLEVFPTA